MSLNKFTDSTTIKDWMKIGCNDINCTNLNAINVTVENVEELKISNDIDFVNQAVTPAVLPAIGETKVYTKTDSYLYSLDSAGVETKVGDESGDITDLETKTQNIDLATTTPGTTVLTGILEIDGINMNNTKITSLLDPTLNQDAATKVYVDTEITTATSDLDTKTQNIDLTTTPGITIHNGEFQTDALEVNSLNINLGLNAGTVGIQGAINIGENAGVGSVSDNPHICIGKGAGEILTGVDSIHISSEGVPTSVGSDDIKISTGLNQISTLLTNGSINIGSQSQAGVTSGQGNYSIGTVCNSGVTTGNSNYAFGSNSGPTSNRTNTLSLGNRCVASFDNEMVMGGSTTFSTQYTHLRPSEDNIIDLGTSTYNWKDLHISGTIKTPDVELKGSTSGILTISPDVVTTDYTITMPPAVQASTGAYLSTVDTSGTLGWTKKIVVRMAKESNQSIPDATNEKITWPVTIENIGGIVISGTSNTDFQVPEVGYYLLTCDTEGDPAVTSWVSWSQSSANSYRCGETRPGPALNISTVLKLAALETISIRIFQNSGVAADLIAGVDFNRRCFSLIRISP